MSLLGLAIAGGTAAANAIGGAITAKKQRKADKAAQEQSRKWEIEDQARQRQWQLEDEKRQNTFNSPEQEMQRLKEAGLNPNLVYGSGATSTQSVSQTPPPVKGHETFVPQYKNVVGQNAPYILEGISDIMGIRQQKLAGDKQELENAFLREYLTGRNKQKSNQANREETKAMGDVMEFKKNWGDFNAPEFDFGQGQKKIEFQLLGQKLANMQQDEKIKKQMLTNLQNEGIQSDWAAQLTKLGISGTTLQATAILLKLLQGGGKK